MRKNYYGLSFLHCLIGFILLLLCGSVLYQVRTQYADTTSCLLVFSDEHDATELDLIKIWTKQEYNEIILTNSTTYLNISGQE